MTLLPIVTRELRVAARRGSTYWQRAGAAVGVILIGTWLYLVMESQPPQRLSTYLFGALTAGALFYALLGGVRATADCLSREKREGTLGLLFLTDLKGCVVEKVFKRGHLVAEKGYLLGNKPMSSMIDVRNTVKIRPLGDASFHIKSKSGRARVMELIPNQIITRQIFAEPKRENSYVVSDTERDILKIAVIERHHGTGNIGLGLTKGFGLKSGAIASSVGHDAHNINVVGTNDADMRAAVEHIVKMQGGFAVANHGEILGSVALPIAGLLSNKPLSDVKDELDAANHATKKLGCAVPEPFMALSFMALSVIPELKLTDRGLVDVNQFKFVDLFEN